jgi:hypothetical protein
MMRKLDPAGLTRRAALAVGLASATAGVARSHRLAQRTVMLRGMFGGGLAELQTGTANVSVVATQLTEPDGDRQVVVGSILWVETTTGLALSSIDVTAYDRPPGRDHGRRIRGTMRVNGAGNYPFVLDVTDDGPPGSGEDTIALVVGETPDEDGPAAATPFGFRYAAAGKLATGDIQDVDFVVDFDGGTDGGD